MERDNKIVLGAVLILLVGMLSFNFSSTLTGNQIKESSDVTVTASPARLEFFEMASTSSSQVTFTVDVKSGKVQGTAFLYGPGPSGGRKEVNLCQKKSECGEGKHIVNRLFSQGDREGQYYLLVKDDNSNKEFRSNTITIVQSSGYPPGY